MSQYPRGTLGTITCHMRARTMRPLPRSRATRRKSTKCIPNAETEGSLEAHHTGTTQSLQSYLPLSPHPTLANKCLAGILLGLTGITATHLAQIATIGSNTDRLTGCYCLVAPSDRFQ